MAGSNYLLRGVGADGGSVRFVLSSDAMTIGRQGDIKLHHESVSRQHAKLELREGEWVLTDLESRNGTFVNRASVQRHVLTPGDIIRFGRVTLRFEVVDSGVPEDDETRAMTMAELTVARDVLQFRSLVGRSAALRGAMRLAAKAAKSESTVLIFGESGTGKELFARLVYSESNRRKGKFLAVNCSAIESTLLGSTLFGHEKGAFTGADRMKTGLFEEANGGTLFLDEIGDISMDMQVKLLRVLQEGEFMRVGGTETLKTNVRVICATNRDLPKAIADGKFREDLYYRLNVIKIDLPPLRDRKEDIPDLANHFAAQLGGEAAKTFTEGAMAALVGYSWPGNVRELQNVVSRAVFLADGQEIDVGDLPKECLVPCASCLERESDAPSTKHQAPGTNLAEMEAAHIRATLEACGGNKKLAAEKLGISRSTLYEKLRECPIPGQGCPGAGRGMAGDRSKFA